MASRYPSPIVCRPNSENTHFIASAMSCKEVTDFLSEYLDGELPLRQRLVFKVHLLACRNCRRYLAAYSATVRMTQSFRNQTPSESLQPIPDELVQAILAARRK